MTCHCGRAEEHPEEHRGKCCDCFDSEVLGDTFREDPDYCSTCDPGRTYTVTVAGNSDDDSRDIPLT